MHMPLHPLPRLRPSIHARRPIASLVQTQRRRPSADLALVPGTLHIALARDARHGRPIRRHAVVAVALAAVLQPGVSEAFALAEVHAALHGHGVARVRGPLQAPRVVVVRPAPLVGETLGGRHVGEALQAGELVRGRRRGRKAGDGGAGGLRARRERRGGAGPRLDGVAAGQGGQGAVHVLEHGRGDLAVLAGGVAVEREVRAVLHVARVVVAVVDGGLQDADVPAVDEVAVEAVAGGVALGEDEGLVAVAGAPEGGEVGDAVDDLEEDGDEVDRVGGGAGAVVVAAALGIGHVGLVVGGVEADAVPAGGEVDLGAQAVGAVGVGEAGPAGVGVRGGEAEADERDGLGGEVGAAGALVHVAGDHAEVPGEGLEGVVVGAGALLVVDGHAALDAAAVAGLRDLGEGVVGSVVEVELGGPVDGEVLGDGAGGALGGAQAVVGDVEGEGGTARDGVHVGGGEARGDDGVGALLHEAAWAGHAPEGVAEGGEGEEEQP